MNFKKIFKLIKEWDKKNSTIDDRIYMLIFLTASAMFMFNLNQAIASLN